MPMSIQRMASCESATTSLHWAALIENWRCGGHWYEIPRGSRRRLAGQPGGGAPGAGQEGRRRTRSCGHARRGRRSSRRAGAACLRGRTRGEGQRRPGRIARALRNRTRTSGHARARADELQRRRQARLPSLEILQERVELVVVGVQQASRAVDRLSRRVGRPLGSAGAGASSEWERARAGAPW